MVLPFALIICMFLAYFCVSFAYRYREILYVYVYTGFPKKRPLRIGRKDWMIFSKTAFEF